MRKAVPLRHIKFTAGSSSISAPRKRRFRQFSSNEVRLFRLQKPYGGIRNTRRSHVRPRRRNGETTVADFKCHAAIVSRVKDLGSAETKRVLHAFQCLFITETEPAADDDVVRTTPIREPPRTAPRAA